MSMMSIVNGEKRLLLHIQLGGTVDDEVGNQLVTQFIRTAASDNQIAKIAADYQISLYDMHFMYSQAIGALMPYPCICDGGPIQIENRVGSLLAPTLFFMEPYRFQGIASEISAKTKGMDDLSRMRAISEIAIRAACTIQLVHDQKFGRAKFRIEPGTGLKSAKGCLVILGFVGAAAAGIQFLSRLVLG